MKFAFIAAAAVLLAPQAAQADVLLMVIDNGALIGSSTSSTGDVSFSGSDAAFASIDVTVDGVLPGLYRADLNSTVNATTSSGFAGTHTLTIDITQTSVFAVDLASTFNVGDTIGSPGPTTETTFVGPNKLFTADSASFPAGAADSIIGPLFNAVGPGQTEDAEEYSIAFTAPGQSLSASIAYAAGAPTPEPSTWAMALIGFAAVGWIARRFSSSTPSTIDGASASTGR